jgi:putative FmdB family regulatory protein
MPTYDYVCNKGHVFDAIANIDDTVITCPACAGESTTGMAEPGDYAPMALEAARDAKGDATIPEGKAKRVLLAMPAWAKRSKTHLGITVHRDVRTGEYRYPATADSPMPPGFEKIEIQDVHQARKIEREERVRAESEAALNQAAARAAADEQRREGEAELKARLGSMSPRGQAFALAAMERNRQREAEKSHRVESHDGGFNVLNYDKSNREVHSDESTGWKGVKV